MIFQHYIQHNPLTRTGGKTGLTILDIYIFFSLTFSFTTVFLLWFGLVWFGIINWATNSGDEREGNERDNLFVFGFLMEL